MICLDCENPDDPAVRDAVYHPGCCPHEEVEIDDIRGLGFCVQCQSPVMAVFDGEQPSWEIV